jgi:hypothetical protein
MTQDRNISTEHQREGDAKQPSDTLDRAQTPGVGRANPSLEDEIEKSVENQGSVKPEDYPEREGAR